MGASFNYLNSYVDPEISGNGISTNLQVFRLAEKVLCPLLDENDSKTFSHLIVATTCPDSLAPTLGQQLADKYNEELRHCHIIDMVQGCAGGVSSMIIGSELIRDENTKVLLINVDAARKATSIENDYHQIFRNGAFSAVLSYSNSKQALLHSKSIQFKGLSDVVTVGLGHDSDEIISKYQDIAVDPRKYLGLKLNNHLATKLIRQAENFFNEFVNESTLPDVMILHQVNPDIMEVLEKVFSKYEVEFINLASRIGNCGSATTGIALHLEMHKLRGRKVMICGFGTGGLITAGLWNF